MTYNQKIGKFGEILAKNYLIRNNYRIIAENTKVSFQEIDIIAYIKGIYVFVEVKTRTSLIYGEADEALSSKKLSNLKKAIIIYLKRSKISSRNVRLDLIAIDINKVNKTANIKHYKDIF
jgi:putative endonuclease